MLVPPPRPWLGRLAGAGAGGWPGVAAVGAADAAAGIGVCRGVATLPWRIELKRSAARVASARVCSAMELGPNDDGVDSIGAASGKGLTYAAVPRPDRSDSIETRSISRAARRRGLARGSPSSPLSSLSCFSSFACRRCAAVGWSIGAVELDVTGGVGLAGSPGRSAGATSTSVGAKSPSRKPDERVSGDRSRCLPLSAFVEAVALDDDDGRSEPVAALVLAPPPRELSRVLRRRRFGSLRRGLVLSPPPVAEPDLREKRVPRVELPAADGSSEVVRAEDDDELLPPPPPLVAVVAVEIARARLRPASCRVGLLVLASSTSIEPPSLAGVEDVARAEVDAPSAGAERGGLGREWLLPMGGELRGRASLAERRIELERRDGQGGLKGRCKMRWMLERGGCGWRRQGKEGDGRETKPMPGRAAARLASPVAPEALLVAQLVRSSRTGGLTATAAHWY